MPSGNTESLIQQTKALVVDDDNDIRYAIARILRQCGCVVTEADSVEVALDGLAEKKYDVVFCDVRFQNGKTGEECLKTVVDSYPATAMVMMSCSMPSQKKIELKQIGAFDCLQKPVFKDTFLRVLDRVGKQQDSKKTAA